MSEKKTSRYRCHYFLKVHRDSWNGSFDFTATNDERAKRYAKAWIRERNKGNRKLIKEGKIEHDGWEIASFQHVSIVTIEQAEKETPI